MLILAEWDVLGLGGGIGNIFPNDM